LKEYPYARHHHCQVQPVRTPPPGRKHLSGVPVLEVLFAGGFTLGLTDIQVRITRNGTFAIEFPTRVATVKGKEERFPHYFTASKESREWLTAAVEALPEIQATLVLARAARAA